MSSFPSTNAASFLCEEDIMFTSRHHSHSHEDTMGIASFLGGDPDSLFFFAMSQIGFCFVTRVIVNSVFQRSHNPLTGYGSVVFFLRSGFLLTIRTH